MFEAAPQPFYGTNETQRPKPMNSPDIKRLQIRTEVIKRYYVLEDNDWHSIYGGPFDTKQEAIECIQEAKEIDAQHPLPHI